MALIKCGECGKEISDTAEHCPNCGWTTRAGSAKEEQKNWSITSYVGAAFTLVGIILLFIGSKFIALCLIISGLICVNYADKMIKESVAEQEWNRKIEKGEIDVGDGKPWKCKCGNINRAGLKHCYSCGQSRENNVGNLQNLENRTRTNSANLKGWKCKCGKWNLADWKYCQCGLSREQGEVK